MNRIAILVLLAMVALAACVQQQPPPEAVDDGAGIAVQDASELFFSEYVEGSSNNKALEIYNGTGSAVDLSAGDYNVQMFFNGNLSAGLTIALTGTVAPGDVHVLAHSSADAAILAQGDQTNGAGWYNGNDAVVLRTGTTVIDAVGQVGSDPGSQWGSDPVSTANNTLRRKASVNAGDADSSDAFDPSVEWDGFATDTFDGLGCYAGTCPGQEPPAIGACGEPATPIHEIQGSGFDSPLDGNEAVIEGVVVGDFQEGDGDAFNTDLGGFYVQEEAADWDADDATSEGIFVFAPDAADVQVGDVVRVAGTVDEFRGLTEITDVSDLLDCGPGEAPDPVELKVLPIGDAERERFEGMLVEIEDELVISEYFNFDRFGEIVLAQPNPEGEDRQFQPTSFVEPGADAAEEAEENQLRRITLDDGRSEQNPDPARHPNGDAFDLDNRFRGGDEIKRLVGIMDYRFGLYRIQPTAGAEYDAKNERPETHEDVDGELKVATFNVLNYFLTIDTGSHICGPSQNLECRGADTEEELERQRAKILAALVAIEADVYGLIEMENTTGVEPLADLVAGLNEAFGTDTYDYIDTGVIGTDAIRVGFVYNADTVAPVGNYAVLDSGVDPRFDDTKNRPVLAQTFVHNGSGAAFTAAVNHLKSKGSACGAGDDDPQQGNCNLTRTRAAEALADWLASDPTGSGDGDVLILGDLNAYDEEDPVQVLLDAGYVDLADEDEFAYTYVFDGQVGHLDYALANANLAEQVTGATTWHINADEPDILDYDTSFKQDAQDDLYAPNPYRSSDHDPVIVGLDPTGSAPCEGGEGRGRGRGEGCD